MSDRPAKPLSLTEAFLLPQIWRKAAPIGLAVGFLQAAVHQGDSWLRGDFTPVVIIKSLVSPLIGLSLSIVSAAASHLGKVKTSSNS